MSHCKCTYSPYFISAKIIIFFSFQDQWMVTLEDTHRLACVRAAIRFSYEHQRERQRSEWNKFWWFRSDAAALFRHARRGVRIICFPFIHITLHSTQTVHVKASQHTCTYPHAHILMQHTHAHAHVDTNKYKHLASQIHTRASSVNVNVKQRQTSNKLHLLVH